MSAIPGSIQPGDRIGNYILQDICGRGSFAQVWKARHHVLDDEVAVKIPTDPQYVRNLQREGVAIHGLRHPNIVRALDLDPYATPPYLIMEYVGGPTLRELIDAHPQGLPVRTAVQVLCGVLEALAAAHAANIVHRDLKPANILLTRDVDNQRPFGPSDVKVGDFGLGQVGTLTTASIMQSGSIQDTPGLSGTIAYMAPEQRDGQDVDHRCDLYACGMLLFEMLTGRRPQGSDLPSALRSDSPVTLDAVFQKCYTRPSQRYDSATDMLADVRRAVPGLGGAPAPAQQPSSTPPIAGRREGRLGCSSCRGITEPDDQFCIHCGLQLVREIRRCLACAAVAHMRDNYCIVCGQTLPAVSDETQQQGKAVG